MTLQTVRSGATAHPEEMFDFLLSHILDRGGVKSIDAVGDLYVSQKAAGANMSVDVNLGFGFVRNSTGTKVYPVRLYGAASNVAVTSNATGNGRIDAVVLYIDIAESPDATATNVAKIAVVPGTAAPSPTAPTDGDISTSIGAANPFIRLANVAVGSGVSEIDNANITDTRVRAITVKRADAYTVVADASTITFDVEKGSLQTTVTANRQLAVENYQAGDEFKIKVIQDGSGNQVPIWWANIDWDGGVAGTFSTAASKADVFAFKVKSDLRFEGYVVGQGMSIA
jgi:hypothetical protein